MCLCQLNVMRVTQSIKTRTTKSNYGSYYTTFIPDILTYRNSPHPHPASHPPKHRPNVYRSPTHLSINNVRLICLRGVLTNVGHACNQIPLFVQQNLLICTVIFIVEVVLLFYQICTTVTSPQSHCTSLVCIKAATEDVPPLLLASFP